jgi:hypothetical protein
MHTIRTLAVALVVGLVAGAGFVAAQAVADQFSDVGDTSPFAGDIDWLTDQDLATGFPDGTFRPNQPVRRGQLAHWLFSYNDRIQTVVASVDPTPASTFTTTVDCPAGLRAVSGSGAATTGPGLIPVASYPSETFQWQVDWETASGDVVDPTSLQVVALCVPENPN